MVGRENYTKVELLRPLTVPLIHQMAGVVHNRSAFYTDFSEMIQ